MLTPWREGTANERQERLSALLVASLTEQGLLVGKGLYAVPEGAFTHPARLPADLAAQLEEGGVQA